MNLPNRAVLCEVGLRDGLQSEARLLSFEQKAALAHAVVAAGFQVVELGSFVSPKAVPQMADTDALFEAFRDVPGVELRALVANVKGVERARQCGCKKIKLNVSASAVHNKRNLNCTPRESVARFAECEQAAKAAGIALSGSISMPFGSPWEERIEPEDVLDLVEAYRTIGVEEISLSDTAGLAVPTQVRALCARVRQAFPGVMLWMHFHNTRGLALANIFAALEEGITHFDASFAGLGGCPFVPGAAGNVATEDVVHMLGGMGIETGVDWDACIRAGQTAAAYFGHSASYMLDVIARGGACEGNQKEGACKN